MTVQGMSLLTSEGEIGRLLSGLPSSRDSGDLSGVPLVAVSPDDSDDFCGWLWAGAFVDATSGEGGVG